MNAKSGKKPEVKPVVTTAQTKAAEVKPAETKEAEVKPVETKTLEAKVAEVEAKATEKLANVKETVKETKEAVKEEVKKAPKKKATRKTAAKKESESETEVFVEYYGQQSSVEEITSKVKEVFVSEGHRVSTIKSLKLYLKPEDGFAYYVINEKFAGRVPLF
ncbi:MAG: DUF6465 family protein [Lachnospiraceae bacterium]|nr:DUF6465 family protein [Lachnospiraceae bacterium]